jgi:tetratricopeptide (TPR) repeat protein
MRIGMTRAFQGRPQEGARYFALAQEHKSRLPLRDRSLLDIYSGFWLELKFNDAIVRLGSFVDHYPDDKEARSIYALVLFQLSRDSVAAFAHLDTVLQSDPTCQLALSIYAQIFEHEDQTDKAIEYVKRIKEHHPESPAPYLRLADLYVSQRKFDEAIEECGHIVAGFPDNSEVLFKLSDLFIRKRDFGQAQHYLYLVAERFKDDPYAMHDYYDRLANLANWKGQFQTGLKHRFHQLEQARLTGDSAYISGAYDVISIYYKRFGFPDSAIVYSREAYPWSNPFQRVDHGISMVSIDHSTEPEARPLFKEALEDFKYRIPANMRQIAVYIEELFDAYCQHDTAAIIAAYENLAKEQNQPTGGSMREAGYLKVLFGRYEEGIQSLQKYVSGGDETMSGFHYPYTLYVLGIANEGLGNTEEAVRYYEEMLQYWGNPEIVLKEIQDARSRLAKLTS